MKIFGTEADTPLKKQGSCPTIIRGKLAHIPRPTTYPGTRQKSEHVHPLTPES